MNDFSEFIESKLKQKSISKTNFANTLKISRLAFYRLLESPEKAKFSAIVNIARTLDINIQEIENVLLFNSAEASHNVRVAKEKLEIENIQLEAIIGIPFDAIDSTLENGNITFRQLNFFSNSVGVPINLFLTDKEKFEDQLTSYLFHKNRIDDSKILSDYFSSFSHIQIEIYNILNHLPNFENDNDSSKDIEYIEEMSAEIGIPIANVHISILGLKNSKPIVIASNLPKDRLYLEHFVEPIFDKVKRKFLANFDTHEVIWVCNTYTSKNIENRVSSLVKFSSDFSKVDFLQLYNHLDSSVKPKSQEILSFLSYQL